MLDLTVSNQVILIKTKAMIITGQGYPIQLVSQNKRIHIWYYRLTYVSKAQVVRVLKLVDIIDLDLTDNKYNSVKVLIDFEDFEIPDNETANPLVDKKRSSTIIAFTY